MALCGAGETPALPDFPRRVCIAPERSIGFPVSIDRGEDLIVRGWGGRWLVLVSMLLIAGSARLYGATYYVPGGFPTIQAAVNAAREGDTIIIAPGDYPENLVMTGVNMTLRSVDPTSPAVVAATRVGAPNGPVIKMKGTEGSSFLVDGLTISNGYGGNCGGIDGSDTPIVVKRCVLENNTGAAGGAFWRITGAVSDNIVRNNRVLGSLGGTLASLSPCIMENNLIEGNSGTYLVYYGPRIFRNNTVTGTGRYDDISRSVLEDFSGNTFTGSFQFEIVAPPGLVFRDNVIRGYRSTLELIAHDAVIESNTIEGSGDYFVVRGFGSGTLVRDLRVVVLSQPEYKQPVFALELYSDSIVDGVHADGTRWGLFVDWSRINGPYGTLRNSVIRGKEGGAYGSLKAIENSTIVSPGTGLDILDADIRNSIVMGRYYGDLRFQNSLLDQYVETGTGNIYTSEPRFVDSAAGDYRLRPDSPAIDAGIKIPDLLTDHLGNPRPVRSRPWMSAGDNSGWDIGAYEYQDLIPLPVVEQQGWMLR